jgi:hypothetical protein
MVAVSSACDMTYKFQFCFTVITENVHPQPTISVMTSTGDFEPLTAISVRGQTTFSNIVILPESALAAGGVSQGTCTLLTNVNNINL